MRKKESENRSSFSPIRGWPASPISPMVSTTYGHYSSSGVDYRLGSRLGTRSPDILSTISGSGLRSTNTISTMSDRYSRAVTSPPRGGIFDPVVVNAGFTFRLTDPNAIVHNHIKVDPASQVPQTQSSCLSKEIDKFLKKSDHTLDRFKEIVKGGTPPPKSPRLGANTLTPSRGPSLPLETSDSRYSTSSSPSPKPGNFSSKGHTPPPKRLKNVDLSVKPSPSPTKSPNASIAEQAERHKKILSRVLRRGREEASIMKKDTSADRSSTSSSTLSLSSTSSNEDDLKWHSSPKEREKSDDTSAEISKLEDLSSGSDEEFFDVQPLPGYFCIPGQPQIRPLGNKGSIATGTLRVTSNIRAPLHSYSLPAVNKLHPSTKMGNKQPYSTSQSKGQSRKYPAPLTPVSREPSIVSLSSVDHKKYPAPPPPISREPSIVSISSIDHKKYPAPPPPISRESSFISLSSESNRLSLDGSMCIDSSSLNGDCMGSLKKLRRDPSFRKYLAPQPPLTGKEFGSSSTLCDTPVNSSPQSVKRVDATSAWPSNASSTSKASSYTSVRSSSSRTPTRASPSHTPTRASPSRTPTRASPSHTPTRASPSGTNNKTSPSHTPARASPSRTSIKSSPSRSSLKSSPQSIKKLDNKRPGSPVPYRSALLPLKKSTDPKVSDKDKCSKEGPELDGINDDPALKSIKPLSNVLDQDSNHLNPSSTNQNNKMSNSLSSSLREDLKQSHFVPSSATSVSTSVEEKSHSVIATSQVVSSTSCSSAVHASSLNSNINATTSSSISEVLSVSEISVAANGISKPERTKSFIEVKDDKMDSKDITNGVISENIVTGKSMSKHAGKTIVNGTCNEPSELSEVTSEKCSVSLDKTKQIISKIDDLQKRVIENKDGIDKSKNLGKADSVESEKTENINSESTDDSSIIKVKKKKKISNGSSTFKDSGSDRSSRSSSVTSSRGVTPDRGLRPVQRKSISGKLATLTNKFETDESSEAASLSSKGNKPSKVSGLASKFTGDKAADTKGLTGKIVSPYSKPFSPTSNVSEKKSSIGGIDISKFGGLGKPKKIKKDSENNTEEVATSKIKKSSTEKKESVDTEDRTENNAGEVATSKIKKSSIEKKESADTEDRTENKDAEFKEETNSSITKELCNSNSKEVREIIKKDTITNSSELETSDDYKTCEGNIEATCMVNGTVEIPGADVDTCIKLVKTTEDSENKNNVDSKNEIKILSGDTFVVEDKYEEKVESNKITVEESSTAKNELSIPEDTDIKTELVESVKNEFSEPSNKDSSIKNEIFDYSEDSVLVKNEHNESVKVTDAVTNDVKVTVNEVSTIINESKIEQDENVNAVSEASLVMDSSETSLIKSEDNKLACPKHDHVLPTESNESKIESKGHVIAVSEASVVKDSSETSLIKSEGNKLACPKHDHVLPTESNESNGHVIAVSEASVVKDSSKTLLIKSEGNKLVCPMHDHVLPTESNESKIESKGHVIAVSEASVVKDSSEILLIKSADNKLACPMHDHVLPTESNENKIESKGYVIAVSEASVVKDSSETLLIKSEGNKLACPKHDHVLPAESSESKIESKDHVSDRLAVESVEATLKSRPSENDVCESVTETSSEALSNEIDKFTDLSLRKPVTLSVSANKVEEAENVPVTTNEETYDTSKVVLFENIPSEDASGAVASSVSTAESSTSDSLTTTVISEINSTKDVTCLQDYKSLPLLVVPGNQFSLSSVSTDNKHVLMETTVPTSLLEDKKEISEQISVVSEDSMCVNTSSTTEVLQLPSTEPFQDSKSEICKDISQELMSKSDLLCDIRQKEVFNEETSAVISYEVSKEVVDITSSVVKHETMLLQPSQPTVLEENSINNSSSKLTVYDSPDSNNVQTCVFTKNAEINQSLSCDSDNNTALRTVISGTTSLDSSALPVTSSAKSALSTPYIKQFIDMSRSPSEMIYPWTGSNQSSFNQKSQSLLQKVSDLFQNFYLKDPRSLEPAIPQNSEDSISQSLANGYVVKEMINACDTTVDQPGHFFTSDNLCSMSQNLDTKDEVKPEYSTQEFQEEVIDSALLSVRPKVRKIKGTSPVPTEVLNVSDILREADERLTRALSKPIPSTIIKARKSDDEEVYADAYDPSHFDTLMPLPNPDDINQIDKRSRSSTPFLERTERSPTPKRVFEETEAILAETDRILRKSRSQHSLRRSFTKSLSGANLNRLTEVTADLAEEHSTAQLASERIEAEQSDRMRLEKEVSELQVDVKRMTNANDKLEMEKLTLRNEMLQHAELNGDIGDDDTSDVSLYKRKYEWAMREMEVLKKQLKQQQEDDLDQLVILKKQLEKKVTDAYEETDEQRQVVAQMKKKSQRLQAEMNDMKILLEEQTSRNNLLEKKQRKFDQEMQVVIEEQRNERLSKEKIQREKDQILSEKYSFEQEVSTLKLELDMKDEKVSSLAKQLNDLNFTGKTEEEVALLRKAKHDLELRIKDQEEELDDLAGQVQMLESARVRLEMSIEHMRKENRKELSQRDEELEEVRVSAQKKIKGLESQLESEHEERTGLVREKHELERRLVAAHSRSFTSVDEESFHRVKKELKKTKALLKDTQTMLEKCQAEGSNKLLMRQLKTQLEDAEFAKNAAIKARQSALSDFAELQNQLEEAQRAKKDTEDKLARVSKEKADMQTQLEESEEEVSEVMKKYKATVSQLSVDQINISEQAQLIADLEHDKQVLQDKLTELSSKVEVLEGETANIHTQRRLQMKIKEVESKLDLELTTRQRLESQITRLKDQVDRTNVECDSTRMKEAQAVDQVKKLNRQLREVKEDLNNFQQKLTDATSRKQEVEKQFELAESEIITLKSDLKLAFKRIEDLQQALQGDLSDSDSEISESKHEPIAVPTMNELMSVIKEDAEEDYKESYA